PFITGLNVPVDYAKVTSADIEEYGQLTLHQSLDIINGIKSTSEPTFENTFVAYDDYVNDLSKAMNNCYVMYWVSPDSLSRVKGLSEYQVLDSLYNQISTDKDLYNKMVAFTETDGYASLTGHRKRLVDETIKDFKLSGIGLESEKLEAYKKLNAEITDLTTQYSINMNTANLILNLDEEGAEGLPENFKDTYKSDELHYDIPVINATRGPVLNNAQSEATRKAYLMDYSNRGADKNMAILDQLVEKRSEIGHIMGYDSYAEYNLSAKMARNPETVWNFINGLIDKSKPKAIQDLNVLRDFRNEVTGVQSNKPISPWDISYYSNQLLKTRYNVDYEKIREYLPMDSCLNGMFKIYQQLLGYEFRKVENASVWHEDVLMYEVYEGDTLRGKFYLDLYPRPNKESWFYGVELAPGKQTSQGYEVPVKMLLGNFTKPTESLPSLLSFGELNTLFHEFGHIMDGVSYKGEFAAQAQSKSDFVEAMSQIFENWIWDYDILSSFAKHYETGEVLPKEVFDKMLEAKNLTSGYSAIRSLRSCTYDMMLYDKYDPNNPYNTDELWKQIDQQMGVMDNYVEGTHPQACWIHINTHPVYYYGYLWSEVYAQDMFTQFEEHGLLDQETGIRYRDLILANGSQRDVVEAVEEFLGRPSNNEAYIKSLGLE
ncbi:MAG: Zn-dependent oligopeptidase, partial [Cyclobacteriaceae bacterium]|nr:Zn-dependent oligopeptidase [Cyclobacteriaceae bacterium]